MALPEYRPQLATLVKTPPSGAEWLHEIKFDGYRIGCRVSRGHVTLLSRNGKDWTAAFPAIAAAAAALTDDALLDGEVAAVLPDGRTSFQALQNASSDGGSRTPVVYFVFDLLQLDGVPLGALPLEERKRRLQALCARGDPACLRYSAHVEGSGAAFFAKACRVGLEGIISKQRQLAYHPGRHPGWTKTKCVLRQEFVVGGFTDPQGARAGIGALLIGHYDGERLVFSGKVGTGFTHETTLSLRRRLDGLRRPTCPFEPPPPGPLGRSARWVDPVLVCDVVFTEWTDDGKIRHPSFQGLRADKRARDVRRERAAPGPAATEPSKVAPGRTSAALHTGETVVAGVRLTHPDRPVYTEPPITKLDLARYYEGVADWILPHVEGRPLTLVRCPAGVAGQCFFMKHSKVQAPAPLRRVEIQEKTTRGAYLVADDAAGIVALVQMGVVEIHTWNAVVDRLEHPDRLVIDLDPGERVDWARVVHGARTVRRALTALDLESFVKTTGGRGLHVVVPLQPHAGWSECLAFTRALSERMAAADPASYTTKFGKAGRENKILLDYLRNNRANTSVAAYSTRARPHAPVSVPLAWDDLRSSLRPAALDVPAVSRRLARRAADPWTSYWSCRQKLTAQRCRALGIR